jgi:hypothetical protein
MLLTPKRWKHFTAMALIGDGVMAVVHPRSDALAWEGGPKVWQKLMRGLRDRPGLTRAIGVVQIAGGIWWALRQDEED